MEHAVRFAEEADLPLLAGTEAEGGEQVVADRARHVEAEETYAEHAPRVAMPRGW